MEYALKMAISARQRPKTYFRSCQTVVFYQKNYVMDWPSQYLDMNAIENLWKIEKDKLGSEKRKTKPELWEKIPEKHYAIPRST